MKEKKETVIAREYRLVNLKFASELTERLAYLKRYFEDVYKPLNARFEVKEGGGITSLEIGFGLVGKNGWQLSVFTSVHKLSITEGMFIHDFSQKYSEEIKRKLENMVVQEGIKSIDQRK
jgi:hypothetical protein